MATVIANEKIKSGIIRLIPCQLKKQLGQKNNISTVTIPRLMTMNFGRLSQIPFSDL